MYLFFVLVIKSSYYLVVGEYMNYQIYNKMLLHVLLQRDVGRYMFEHPGEYMKSTKKKIWFVLRKIITFRRN